MQKLFGSIVGLMLALGAISCGGSGGDGVTTPPPPPPPVNCADNTVCMVLNNFSPKTLSIPVNTTVSWLNDTGVIHNITWDTPAGKTAAGSSGDGTGDIPDFSSGTHSRKFTVAGGPFTYTCTQHAGMTGTITVTP
ncbi:MAG: plastocyanin/azurin family copper-binding protein [Gemmatimonadaceae bacterium]